MENNLAELNSIHYLVDKGADEEKIKKRLQDTKYELLGMNRGVASFKNKDDGSIAVSVKGTDIRNPKDLISDIKLGLGFGHLDKQFQGRKKQIKEIYKKHPDADKYITGHSLGGSIVSSAMANSKSIRDNTKKAHLFNTGYTPSFHSELSKKLSKDDTKELKNKIIQHHVVGDLISGYLGSKRIGKLKKYKIDSINPIAKHSLSSLIEEL